VKPEELKPKPLITGDDLIAQGMKPGPIFGKLLHEIEDAQLEGRITTREQALDLVGQVGNLRPIGNRPAES
jgi:hypothetical protein